MQFGGQAPRRLAVSAAVVIGVLTVGTATISNAAGTLVKACGARLMSQPFVPWGDANNYFVAPSGTFEYGTSSWTVSGSAWTVAENEPWRVNGVTDYSSMQLLPASSVRSRSFCVGTDEDSIRLFVRRPGVAGSALSIRVTSSNPIGTATNTYTLAGDAPGWAPSPRIGIPNLLDVNGQQTVTIEIAPVNNPAVWLIDDVMVDPWSAK